VNENRDWEVFEKYPPDAMCSGGFRKETEIGGFICPILIVRDFSEKSSAGDGSKRMRFSVKQFGGRFPNLPAQNFFQH